jgi:hypothetical protein
MSPFARKTGCVSHALLAAVRFVGAAEPSTGAIEIEVRRPRFFAAGDASGEHDGGAVRSEGVLLVAAEGLRGHISIEPLRNIDGRARLAVGPDVRDEEMRARAVAPRVPVADEQPVVHAPGGLLFLFRVGPILRAFQVRAVDEDFHADGDAIAGGRDFERADVARIVRDLRCLAAGELQPPHLRRARARGQEVDALAVRGPTRVGVVRRILREPARACVLGTEVEQPQVRAALVRLHVRLAQREDDVATVGRGARVAQPLQPHQIVHREGLGGRLRQQHPSHEETQDSEKETYAGQHGRAPIGKKDRAF